jgi:hypothetical protein
LVGVAGDTEGVLVVHPMVFRTERHQVPGAGGAVLVPVDDVVDFDDAVVGAAGDPAALVAQHDDPPCAFGDEVLGSSEVERDPVVFPDGLDDPVAADLVADAVGDPDPGRGECVAGGGVEVDPDLRPIPLQRCVDPVEEAFDDLAEAVGVADAALPGRPELFACLQEGGVDQLSGVEVVFAADPDR